MITISRISRKEEGEELNINLCAVCIEVKREAKTSKKQAGRQVEIAKAKKTEYKQKWVWGEHHSCRQVGCGHKNRIRTN